MLVQLRQLRQVLRPQAQRHLVVATLGSVVVALLDSLGLILILPLVNVATGQSDRTGVIGAIRSALGEPSPQSLTVILTAAVVTLFVLKDVGSLTFMWWLNGFIFTERARTSAVILSRMLSAPYAQISRRSSSELMRTVDDAVLGVFTLSISGLMQTVANGISVLALFVTLAVISPIPTVSLLVYFGLAALAFTRLTRPRASAAGAVMNDASMRAYRAAFAALGAVKEVKLRGTQNFFVDRYLEAQTRGAYAARTASFIMGIPKYLLEILFIVAVGIVLALGAAGGTGGAVGLLALFVGAGFRLLPAISTLLGSTSSIRVGADALRVVHAEMTRTSDRPTDQDRDGGDGDGDGGPVTLHSHLRVEGLWFRYPGAESYVLRDVTLEVARGSSLALVGSSGAGKTTLADIVVGLYAPTRGRVAVDGRNVTENLRSWQRSVAYVAQDVFLLEGTLAENVAFDQLTSDIDRERVRAVLAQAQLDEVVESLDQGLDTPVGERGARLSGGQRQRIGIARALYRQCDVLVLDEATSALDNETEHRVNQAISALSGSITVVVIAHRLSTVKNCDQVVHLVDGGVQSRGTFDQVRACDSDFARLVRLGSLDVVAPVVAPGAEAHS